MIRLMSRALMLLSLVSVSLAARAAGDEVEVHELTSAPDKYVDRPLVVVGRFASAGGGRMRLVGSNVEFRLGPEIHLYANPQHIEVTGRLEKQGSKHVFQAQRLQKVPSEAEQFAKRRELISATNYPALYELSAWAGLRAKWYDDAALKRLAAKTWREGFKAEEEELAHRGRADDLLALAARGEKQSIDPAELVRVRHRALWIKVAQLDRADSQGRLALAKEVQTLLPGADAATPMASEVASVYERDPETTYRDADAAVRTSLHRAMYRKLVREALLLEAAAPDADFADLAQRVEALTPENGELVHEFKRRELEKQAVDVGRLSRGEALRLSEAFAGLDLAERGTEVLREWLAARRAKLEESEVEDRLALARDYRQLLEDAVVAEALYREVLEITPSSEAEQGLANLGLVNIGGNWHRPSEAPAPRAVQTEGVGVGQSEQMVLAQLGSPDTVSRLVGAGWMLEHWRYEGPPQLWIYLRRSTATGQAHVERVVAP